MIFRRIDRLIMFDPQRVVPASPFPIRAMGPICVMFCQQTNGLEDSIGIIGASKQFFCR